MKKIISDITSKVSEYVYIISSAFYNSSGKTKIILAGSVIAISVSVIMILPSSSSQVSSYKKLRHLSMTDTNGDKWTLKLLKGQPWSRFKDKADKLGPPLLVKTDMRVKNFDVSIGLTVEGQAGEKYAGGAEKNGKRLPPPKLKIIDEAGEIIDSGQFEYG